MASSSRKVSVKFDGDASGLDRSAKLGSRSLSSWQSGLDKVSKAFGRTSKESDTAVTKVNTNLTKVDSQLKATRDRLDGLTKKFAETGDIKLFSDMSRDTSLIKKLENVRKQIGDAGDDSAKGFAARFSGSIGPLMMQAPISPPLITAVAAAAPALAQVVGGAISAGVAIGVAAIGVKLATKDPKVQAAGKLMGAEIGKGLATAAEPFVPATLKAIDIIRGEFAALRPQLRQLFADGAKYVEPLTRAAAGFARELLPGLVEANKNAEAIVVVLGEHGPKAAKAFGTAIATMTQDSKQNATAVDALLTGTEFGISSAANNIRLLGKAVPVPGRLLMQWVAGLNDTKEKAAELPPPVDASAAAIAKIAESTTASTAGLAAFMAKIDEMIAKNFEARSASRDFEAAIDTATEAVKRGGKAHADRNGNISDGTAKGREYNAALDDLAAKTNAAYQATLTQTGSQERANDVLATGREKFIATATAMGMSSTAAKRLADQLFGIPSPKVKVSVETAQATAAIKAVVDAAGKIKDIHRGIYYVTHGLNPGLKVPGGTIRADRWGGVHEGGYAKAQNGLLRDASVYSPRSPGRYMIAEPATGGEAFIPKHGNRRRSLSILDRAASWYGAQLATPGGSSGGPTQVALTNQILLDGHPVAAIASKVVTASVDRQEWRTRVGRR